MIEETVLENFGEMFQESVETLKGFSKRIVKGVIVDKDQYYIVVDVGLKSEGKVLISEFSKNDQTPELNVGDTVEVYIEHYENRDGSIVLSRLKAEVEEDWYKLQKEFAAGNPVEGEVLRRVKGGFAVSIGHVAAFLPGSQLDIRPIKNINSLVGTTQSLKVLKMDKERFNVVVSRKEVIAKQMAERGEEFNVTYEEGQIVEGIVKNITGYGAFIDLDHIDGLLHVTDISWNRVLHPSDVLQLGSKIKLKVIKINPENNRISLGLKQLTEDPWDGIIQKYSIGDVLEVKVVNIVAYGLFVSLEDKVEGLVHISELSWSKYNSDVVKNYAIGDVVTVKIIEIDNKKRRMHLSVKQCQEDPLVTFSETHAVGDQIEVVVKSILDTGVVVKINDQMESFIRIVDLGISSKEELSNFKVNDVLSAYIVKFEFEQGKLFLSTQQNISSSEPLSVSKGDIVKGRVSAHKDGNLEIELEQGIIALVKTTEISSDPSLNKVETFPIDSSIKGIVSSVNKSKRTVFVSLKALESKEQDEHLQELNQKEQNTTMADALNFAKQSNKKE